MLHSSLDGIKKGGVNSTVGCHCTAVHDDYCLNVANCYYDSIIVRDKAVEFSDDF